jgi:CMP-N,N'-diacetyllegionaminic acid synthase
MNVIAIIPARSGSKSVPHKNIRLLGDIPLLGWTIKAASKSRIIDKLILTTDSDEYFKIAKSFHKQLIFHKRSPQLSEDVPSELVLLDILKNFKDWFSDDSIIVMLQPTTPFITSNDIDACINQLLKNDNFNTCITVKQVSEFPEWMITQDKNDDKICKTTSKESIRQNIQKRWIPNGGAYAVRKKFLEKNKSIIDKNGILIHEMSKIRSMDIDEEEDFQICESIVKSNALKD